MKRTSGRIGVGLVLVSTLIGACLAEREDSNPSSQEWATAEQSSAGISDASNVVFALRNQLERSVHRTNADAPQAATALAETSFERMWAEQAHSSESLLAAVATGEVSAKVDLPEHADGFFQLKDSRSGLSIHVGLIGANSSTREDANGFSVYRSAYAKDAHLVHRITANGTEDYVYFPKVLPDKPELRYDLQFGEGVAGLRLLNETIEVMDIGGAPRLRMTPPYAVDGDGRRLALKVAIEGCAYDTSAGTPWDRPVVAPGANHCTVRVSWSPDAKAPLVVDPVWTATANMSVPRVSAIVATFAGSNALTTRILVAGGDSGDPALVSNSVEIYDESTNTWATAPALIVGRTEHAHLYLPPPMGQTVGYLYVTGGRVGSTYLPAVEKLGIQPNGVIPMNAPWVTVPGQMMVGRARHSMHFAGDKLALVGGIGVPASGAISVLNTIETFMSGQWQALGQMTSPRAGHAVAALGANKLLIFGGEVDMAPTPALTASIERCDFNVAPPTCSSFFMEPSTPYPAMKSARANFIVIPEVPPPGISGKVFIMGGKGLPKVEAYDVTANKLDYGTGTMLVARTHFTATTAFMATGPSLRYVLAGGLDDNGTPLQKTELFDVASQSFTAGPKLTNARARHIAAPLSGSAADRVTRVLVAGGDIAGKTAEILGCSADADCGNNGLQYCTNQGFCVPLKNLDAPCNLTTDCWGGQCKNDICLNGYCSNQNVCVPLKQQGDACNHTTDCSGPMCLREICSTKHCADGLCCDQACGEQCFACDSPDSLGTCTPITDAPHGKREPCTIIDTPEDGKCGGFCNGAAKTCQYPINTVCGTGCDKGTFTTLTCDGMAHCNVEASSTSCGVYSCKNTDVCNTGCATNTECADGFVCNTMTSTCISSPTTCSSSIPGGELDQVSQADGSTKSCLPFKCSNNACLVVCNTAYDCLTGYVCNESGTCVKPVTDPDGAGEATCSTSPSHESSRFGWLAALAIAGAFASRRRRA